jgi:hypothetical protein
LVLALGLLPALVACANSSASTHSTEVSNEEESGTRVAAQAGPAKPQQVVQRIEPVPAATPEAELAPTAGEAGQLPAAAGGASARSDVPRVEGARPAGITSKHLEAELNRLEDELKK